MAPSILLHDHDGVFTVTMSNPERKNALTKQMFVDLAAAFRDAHGARALVLRGDGENFCTGADLTDPAGISSSAPVEYMRTVSQAAYELHALKIPTLAAVDGLAVGAGLALALGCDLVMASDRARFSMIFAQRALSLDLGASWFLTRRVGMTKAKELSLLAEILDSTSAKEAGLVNWVVEAARFNEEVDTLASRLGSGPTLAYSRINALLDSSPEVSLLEALEAESLAQVASFRSADTVEAMSAFMEKRPATFLGH
ncbi:MAG: enoyl-CoA hydratase-related protein [Actinomycetota bacterium]